MIRLGRWTGVAAGLLLVTLAGGLLLWPHRSRPPKTLQDLPEEPQVEFRSRLQKAREEIRFELWDEAEANLQACLSIFQADPDVYASLGEVHLGRRLASEAPFVSEDAEDALIDRSLSHLENALTLDPVHLPALKARFRIRQLSSLRRYDPDGALADGEEILRLEPEDFDFRDRFITWLLGSVRFRRARKDYMAFDSAIGLEVAERHLERVLDRAPVGTRAYFEGLHRFGLIHLNMGDFEGAAESFRKLDEGLSDQESRARNLLNLGTALYRLGRHEEAAEEFRRSIEIRRTLEGAWLLGLAYEGLGREPSDLPPDFAFQFSRGPVPDPPPKLSFTEMGQILGVAKVDGAGPSAFADMDGDGDPDLLVAGCDTFTALFRNDGEEFTDVTIEAGLHQVESGFSTNLVDYDNDGHLDIYISRNGWNGNAPNILLRNKGDGTFEDRSKESGLDDPGCGFVSLWSDFNRDGLLDVFIANGVIGDGHTNRLYRNRGDGTFEDATERAGLAESRRWRTIGAAIGDYDRDGDPDIFVNGWGGAPNRLYRNGGDGRFDEVADEAGVTAPHHDGYVAFFIDYNNDAQPDLLGLGLARWEGVLRGLAGIRLPKGPGGLDRDGTRLYRNNRNGTFTDVTFQAGLIYPHGTMGANVGDLDNDGFIDIYLGTGAPDLKRLEPSTFYRNNGDGTFQDLTRYLDLGHVGKGHGFTFADYDLDGDLDIYAPQGGFCHGDQWANPFYRNDRGSQNHWLHLRLLGVRSNRFAVGAQVTLKGGEGIQYREVEGGIGFGSTNSYPVEFGLGRLTRVDEVEILWPSGERQALQSPPIDSMIEVTELKEGFRVVHTGRKR